MTKEDIRQEKIKFLANTFDFENVETKTISLKKEILSKLNKLSDEDLNYIYNKSINIIKNICLNTELPLNM